MPERQSCQAVSAHRTDPNSEGEERLIALALGNAGHVLVVSYTLRDNEIHPVSPQHATRREVKAYAS
ncbi:MAG: BrnT family toxin [Aeromicrobium sp.]|nr:BrnT family toxin [Burkholderiales bacterium]